MSVTKLPGAMPCQTNHGFGKGPCGSLERLHRVCTGKWTLCKSRSVLVCHCVHLVLTSESFIQPFTSWWADPEGWTSRLILDSSTSTLYQKLCNFNSSTNQCEFKSTVILDEDIPCDGSCDARRATWDGLSMPCECSIDEPRTVKLYHNPNMGKIIPGSLILSFMIL